MVIADTPIPELRRLRQENQEFGDILGYIPMLFMRERERVAFFSLVPMLHACSFSVPSLTH